MERIKVILQSIRTWYIKKNDWRMRMNMLMENLLLWANNATYLQTNALEELETQYAAVKEDIAELGKLVLRRLPKANEEYTLLKEHVIAYYQACRKQIGKETGRKPGQADSYRAIAAAEKGIVKRISAIHRMLRGDVEIVGGPQSNPDAPPQ